MRHGDAADNDPTLKARLMTARATLKKMLPKARRGQAMSEVCADEGYFATEQIARLQQAGIRTIIGDPQQTRRKKENQTRREKRALHRAKCAVRSASGKALLRKRGEHLERGFCHVLDHGGLRRATLRGTEKLSKRLIIAALTHNLSLLLRQQTGNGTAKQALAAAVSFILGLLNAFRATCSHFWPRRPPILPISQLTRQCHDANLLTHRATLNPSFSTGG